MFSDQPAQILALLHEGGDELEIGGTGWSSKASGSFRMEGVKVIVGFAAIYLIWGSTYLGIRYAVETIPPLFMMGVRHLLAGTLVYGWVRRRGTPAPTAKQWGCALVAGALLFVGGHGILAWAEQKIPSGLAALLCATLPLWTVLVARIDGSERKLEAKAWAGLLVGFGGVALLIGPDFLGRRLDLPAAGAAMASALLWTVGTSYARKSSLPTSAALSAAMQMMSGGAMLLLSGVVTGEGAHLDVAAITLRSALALAYLTVFGSIVAFTVYVWLLTVSSPSRVSTFAYVNPVVAVFLGWMLAGEAMGVRIVAATAVILMAVGLVNTSRKREAASISLRAMAASRPREMAAD